MSRRANLTGQRFGLVTAFEHAGRDRHGKTLWRVRCDCGHERVLSANSLDQQPPRTHIRCEPVTSPVVEVPADTAELRAQVLLEVQKQWLKLRAAGAFGTWLAAEVQAVTGAKAS